MLCASRRWRFGWTWHRLNGRAATNDNEVNKALPKVLAAFPANLERKALPNLRTGRFRQTGLISMNLTQMTKCHTVS